MNIEKPEITPICCSKEAKWVVQSPNLAYWYCSICKCEPKPVEQSDWYGLQATLDEINAGINKANGLSNCNHSGLAAWLPSPSPTVATPAPAASVGFIYDYHGPRGKEEVRLMNISRLYKGDFYDLLSQVDAVCYSISAAEWGRSITLPKSSLLLPNP